MHQWGFRGLAPAGASALPRGIIKAAAARPKDLGLPFTTWSLPKLQEYLSQQPGLKGITRSTIRRRLHQEGFHFYEGQTWCESNDPDFESKKTKS